MPRHLLPHLPPPPLPPPPALLLPLLPLLLLLSTRWVADAACHSLYHGLLEVKCVPFLPGEPVSAFSLDLLPVSHVMASPVVCLRQRMTVRGRAGREGRGGEEGNGEEGNGEEGNGEEGNGGGTGRV